MLLNLKKNQYTIMNMQEQRPLVAGVINNQKRNECIYQLIEKMLPRIHSNGMPVDISRCVVVDLIQAVVQPFPIFHTDIEWGIFDQSDGFQIWYLYDNTDYVGNMFILETEHVLPSTHLYCGLDDTLEIRNQCDEKMVAKYKHYTDINPTVRYLGMKPGECLIFGKNLYHKSDHRISQYRQAVNFRVVIADPDGGINVNPDIPCFYRKNFRSKISRNGVKRLDNRIYPKMFDFLSLY
jgi:hypothetical protein